MNEDPAQYVPDPLYPCAMPGCADIYTWSANDLRWFPAFHTEFGTYAAGFYCGTCDDGFLENDAAFAEISAGPTLQEFLDASYD